MDLPAHATRMDGHGTFHHAARKATAVIASAWHSPKQRRLALALGLAVLAAGAFARNAEGYLTKEPPPPLGGPLPPWVFGGRGGNPGVTPPLTWAGGSRGGRHLLTTT